MQNLFSTLSRLTIVVAGALALGSCSRSEYAFLPRSASYLGTTAAAPKARKAPSTVVVTPAPAAETALAPVTAAPVAAAVSAPATPKAPVAAPPKTAVVTPQAAAEATTVATAPAAAPKLNLVQRLALNKVMRKLDKQTQKMSARLGESKATAARSAVDGKLRYAIIFGAISLIFFIIGGSVGNVVGTILLVVALLFLLFWLLDNL